MEETYRNNNIKEIKTVGYVKDPKSHGILFKHSDNKYLEYYGPSTIELSTHYTKITILFVLLIMCFKVA